MIRLDRGTVTVPGGWAQRVADKLPDSAAYAKEAAKFEKLPVDSAKRKKGFKEYAPGVLPKGKGGK